MTAPAIKSAEKLIFMKLRPRDNQPGDPILLVIIAASAMQLMALAMTVAKASPACWYPSGQVRMKIILSARFMSTA